MILITTSKESETLYKYLLSLFDPYNYKRILGLSDNPNRIFYLFCSKESLYINSLKLLDQWRIVSQLICYI